MKKTITRIVQVSFLAATILANTGCKDFLERTPESIVSEDQAFVNFLNFQGFVEELYHCIPNLALSGHTSSFNIGDEEIVSTTFEDQLVTQFDRGNFWRWQPEVAWGGSWLDRGNTNTGGGQNERGIWTLAWYGIRKANLGLSNLHRLTGATAEEKNLIEGQLLFFRAYFHFSMNQYWGGLPYIDELLLGDEPLRETRLSYHESAEKAAADFRRAADILPVNWDQTVAGTRTLGKNQLRINKIMALGFLGKNLLYAGSPLMNQASTGSSTYNSEFCRRAATVFGELLQLVESGQTQYALQSWESYREIFLTKGRNWLLPGGTEAIFRAPITGANNSNWGVLKAYVPDGISENTQGTTYAPTANYVKLYSMSNGLPLPDNISEADPVSGYDPSFPWRNRDPRFYQNFYYDGVRMVAGSTSAQYRHASLHSGGAFRDARTSSRTGFLMRKFLFDGYNSVDQEWRYANTPHFHVPLLRLADVYLMYAEASLMGFNAVNGKSSNFDKDALEAVNTIRQRAGMVPVHQNFTGSVSLFLQELYRERAVELSFEAHRFNDLRRWLLLTDPKYASKTALEFDRTGEFSPTDPINNQVANLREVTLINRKYEQKHYWLPMKINDITIYPEFFQNPGW